MLSRRTAGFSANMIVGGPEARTKRAPCRPLGEAVRVPPELY